MVDNDDGASCLSMADEASNSWLSFVPPSSPLPPHNDPWALFTNDFFLQTVTSLSIFLEIDV